MNGMEISQLLGQAELEAATAPLVREQPEFSSWMWERRAGNKPFLLSSFAQPVNTLPDTVGTSWKHQGSEPTFQLSSIQPHSHAASIVRFQALPHAHIQSHSNTASQKSVFEIQKPTRFWIPVQFMCHPFISIVIISRTGLTLILASFVFSINSKQIFHLNETSTALQPEPATKRGMLDFKSNKRKQNQTENRSVSQDTSTLHHIARVTFY